MDDARLPSPRILLNDGQDTRQETRFWSALDADRPDSPHSVSGTGEGITLRRHSTSSIDRRRRLAGEHLIYPSLEMELMLSDSALPDADLPARPVRRSTDCLTIPTPAFPSRKRHSIAGIPELQRSPSVLFGLAPESDEEDTRMSCASSVVSSDRRRRSSVCLGDSGRSSPGFDLQRLVEELKVKQTIEFEHDWTMLVTPQNGTVWVNYKRKLYRQFPPNYVVRRQQEDLKRGEQERARMSNRISELEASLAKTEERIKRSAMLEEQFGDLQLRNDEAEAQLRRSNKALERAKEEAKKMEEQNQQQANEISSLQSRLNKLQERVSELDEKEEKIESLTESLDKVRANIREKEFEVTQMRRRCEQADKEVETMKEKMEELQLKNDDLKYQVRTEIDRNARMAQGLDDLEHMRETTARTLKEMEAVNVELSDKSKLLTSARRSIREYRDKTRDLEGLQEEARRLREELTVSQYENSTLKRLMVGKDSLVVQKTQALDLARQLIEHLKAKDERVAAEVEKVLETTTFVPTFPNGNGRSERHAEQPPFIESCILSSSHGDLTESRSGGSVVSRASSMRSTLRPCSVSTRDLLDIRSVPFSRSGSEANLSSQGGSLSSAPNSHRASNGHARHAFRPQTAVVRPQQRNGEVEGDRKQRRVRSDTERVASLFVHLGDRVQVNLGDDSGLHLATVKYIGQLDRGAQDKRVYVGLKLDETLGNCDGVHNGVRYFNVAQNRGRIVRISAVHAILNIKTDQFRQLEECLREYAKHRRQC